MVRQKRLCVSGVCPNNVWAPYCKDWNPRYPSNTSECLQFPRIPLRYSQTTPQIPPQTSPGNSRYQQTTTDDNRWQQSPTDTLRHWQVLSMFGSVYWRMLSSVDILSFLEMSGGCFGDVWVVSGGIWVVFMETRGTQRCFRSIRDSSPYKMEPWHYFGTALKHITFFARPYWGIKISKCLYIRLTKIIGL